MIFVCRVKRKIHLIYCEFMLETSFIRFKGNLFQYLLDEILENCFVKKLTIFIHDEMSDLIVINLKYYCLLSV